MTARPASHRRRAYSGPPPRRGVLLLVVLSMLTLFLMLGAAYIVSATRAKEAARAHARLTFGGDEARLPHGRIADMVLLEVLRGGTASPPTSPVAGFAFESLLADKYGHETILGVMAISGSGPILSGTLQLQGAFENNTVRATDLNGRLLTFAAPGRPVSTFRVIRVNRIPGAAPVFSRNRNTTGDTFILSVAVPRRLGSWALPRNDGPVIINGREFAGAAPANEGWDGFDAANPFLARVAPGATIAGSSVSRISYFPSLDATTLSATADFDADFIPDAADNDNDGVLDGLFLDFGIPDVTDGHGNVVNVRASVLVVDLDGRFNVNAHGSLAPLLYTGTHPNWPPPAVSGSFADVPLGSGYGPAEIAANLGAGNEPRSPASVRAASPRLFDSASIQDTGTFQSSENPKLFLLAGAQEYDSSDTETPRLRGLRPANSRFSVTESTPRLFSIEGKYAWRAPLNPAGIPLPDGWLSGSNTLSQVSDFPWARPGERTTDDAASRIRDRLARATSGNTVNYGVPRLWWTGTTFDWGTNSSDYPPPRGVYNSPPDLHGRMKTLTLAATGSAIVPQVAFAQPEWSGTGTNFRETTDDPYELRLDTRAGFGGWLHDPMKNGAAMGDLNHNPFTPAELEPVLRPYDIDTNRLPPRLAAMLGSAAEEARLRVTTDSWDTTAITGSAAVVLFGNAVATDSGWMQLSGTANNTLYGTASPTAAVTGVIGGEVSRGEKFDLNRPFVAASGAANAGYTATSEYVMQRQAYFKDLYTLLVGLQQGSGATPSATTTTALAQWAANVVEFRDADSRVIPFEYDANPRDGWIADGNVITPDSGDRRVIWGAERPEIVIQEAFAWRNTLTGSAGMAIALHRPWNAKAYASGSTNFIDAEPCDLALDTLTSGVSGSPTNQIDLGKKGNSAVLATGTFDSAVYNNVSGTSFPIWRLRITSTSGTSYVRFDSNVVGTGTHVLSPANGNDKPKMAPDSTLSLVSGTLVRTGSGAASGTARLGVSGSSRTVGDMRMPGTAMSGTVFLERFSDPSVAPSAAQWSEDPTVGSGTTIASARYLIVDQARIDVVNTGTVPVAATSRKRATTDPAQAFWRPPVADTLGTVENGGTLAFPSSLASGSTAWLPWPNRPFTSAAELLLVPQGTAMEILENYRRLTPAESGTIGLGKGVPIALHLLFDAVHVPSRFAGIHTTTGSGALGNLSAHGIFSPATGVATVTANQLSSWREPGRVNLNTVVAEDVWNAVVAGPLAGPAVTGTAASLGMSTSGTLTPATSLFRLLALNGSGTAVVSDTTTTVSGSSAPMPSDVLDCARNPLHEIYTATRLANTVTPRSNVFAIWITIRESVAGDPDSVRYRRAFYVVDRSIPVGFQDGMDLNVWDCVRLRRMIE